MVESGGLENRCTARYRGFESHPLRHLSPRMRSPGPTPAELCRPRERIRLREHLNIDQVFTEADVSHTFEHDAYD